MRFAGEFRDCHLCNRLGRDRRHLGRLHLGWFSSWGFTFSHVRHPRRRQDRPTCLAHERCNTGGLPQAIDPHRKLVTTSAVRTRRIQIQIPGSAASASPNRRKKSLDAGRRRLPRRSQSATAKRASERRPTPSTLPGHGRFGRRHRIPHRKATTLRLDSLNSHCRSKIGVETEVKGRRCRPRLLSG